MVQKKLDELLQQEQELKRKLSNADESELDSDSDDDDNDKPQWKINSKSTAGKTVKSKRLKGGEGNTVASGDWFV